MRERAYLLLTSLRGTATFQGRQRCKKLFCLPSVNGSTLKGKFFFLRMSTFSLLEKRPFQKGFGEQESKQKLQKLSPLKKMAENLPSVSSPLNLIFNTLSLQQLLLPLFLTSTCACSLLSLVFLQIGLYCRAYQGCKNRPAGTCRLYNVGITSMQRQLRRINVDTTS